MAYTLTCIILYCAKKPIRTVGKAEITPIMPIMAIEYTIS